VVVLAELEIYHSRPIAPTRRVAVGESVLPCDPAPGFGGILLGGLVAAHIGAVDPDLRPDLTKLTVQLEQGQRIPQPRLRYRFQHDRVGLLRSRHRLVGDGEELRFEFDDRGMPAQYVLGAVYAAGALPTEVRHDVMTTLRRAMRWGGAVGPDLVAALAGFDQASFTRSAFEDPIGWALDQLGFGVGVPTAARGGGPDRADVVRRFRLALREAHPDHGGEAADAAQRIADLTEARRILLGRTPLAG